jgi:hypothetical protein
MSAVTRIRLEKQKDSRSLLQIVLDVHMDCTGNQERSRAKTERDIETLRIAVKTWETSVDKWHDFDEHVRRLIYCTLADYAIWDFNVSVRS